MKQTTTTALGAVIVTFGGLLVALGLLLAVALLASPAGDALSTEVIVSFVLNFATRCLFVLVGALLLLRNPSVARVAFATLILAAFALGADVLAMMLQGGSETPLAYRIAAAVGSFVVLLAIAGLTVGSLFWLRKGATREEFGGGSAV